MSVDGKKSGNVKGGISSTPTSTPMARHLVGFAISAVLLATSFCVALFLGLNQKETKRHTPPRNIPSVNGIRLQVTNFTIHLPSQGRVQARALTSINPEVSGRIISVEPSFKEGGFFQPGQKLLTLDNSDYLSEVVKAKATITQ